MEMKKNIFRVFVLAGLLCCGCRDGFTVRQALERAGENRPQLEAVLEHFKESGDKEKYLAAEYLIKNMPGHKSMTGEYRLYYDAADSVLRQDLPADSIMDGLEGLSADFGSAVGFGYDIQNITADYLIKDIDNAFIQWREGEWATHLSFPQFCEWLLPYTCSDTQPIFDWRDSLKHFAESYIPYLNECNDYLNNPRAAICRANSALKNMIAKQTWIHSAHGYTIYNPDIFVKLPGATCEEYAEVATLVMRSKGIPVSIDFTPQWPDRLYGHYWCVFPTLRGKTSMFNPFATNPDYPHYSHAEFAKVFRRTYGYNGEYMDLLARNRGNIPPIFSDPFFRDVSEEYMETVNLSIRLMKGKRTDSRDVYIAVFDNSDWKPVFWGRRHGNTATFRSMGKNITYIVLGYIKGHLEAVSLPFMVDFSGAVHYIKADPDRTTDIRMDRKYPMFQHVFIQQAFLHGGYIEASDNSDFKGKETVARFPDWPLTSGQVRPEQSRPHRYWRMYSAAGQVSDMAELFFYDKEDTTLIEDFKICGSDSLALNLTDRDPLTFYSADSSGCGWCFDFGKPVSIDHISYIRRGDGNAVMPGDRYIIYYWDGTDWIRHSEHEAEDIYIDVRDLPAGALYYIKGISRGAQNRIFTWDEHLQKPQWH